MKCEHCHKNPAVAKVMHQQIDINGEQQNRSFQLCHQCLNTYMTEVQDIGNIMPGNGFTNFIPNQNKINTSTITRQEKSSTPTLDEFGRDITADIVSGKIDPAAGREKELRRLITVLGRRQKNNPVLIGAPGVGKTAIVEGLAKRIQVGNVPTVLKGKRIVSLNIGGIVAGAMFRGQFEQRIKMILEELRNSPDTIVFIDELHTVVGAGAADGAVGASDMLKPALARGEIHCIGATTLDEYRQNIEKDAALERRFQPIIVNEPSLEEAVDMLKIVRSQYEAYHGVNITDAAINAAVKLSDRYINDRYLPDKAIDVMDEASSALRLEASEKGIASPTLIVDLEKQLVDIQTRKEVAANVEDYEQAALLRQKELLVLTRLEKAKQDTNATIPLIITPEHIAEVVETWTGIPVSQMLENERQNLQGLEEDLRKRVIGQNEAISAVVKAIRRARAGLKDPKRPIGSFLFLGPTGVGKTELVKALAIELFGGENNLIRFDMSEYMEAHTVSRLFGSPPGYVGYDDGGQLTEQVRRQPYSIILFDEIEKAHPEVFNSLLQILDDGRLTDGQGRTVDFKNTIIIMTSNAGSNDLKYAGNIGFLTRKDNEHDVMQSKALEGLKTFFAPEFLNRIDQIVVFRSLNQTELYRIVDLLLAEVKARLNELNINLIVGDEVKNFLLQVGYDQEYGARPLRRAIQTYIDDVLADALLTEDIQSGQTVKLIITNKQICVVSG